MAFFCDKTGVRIVAPGTSKSAGGISPEHDGSDAAIAAENAANKALQDGRRSPEEIVASPEAKEASVAAALAAFEPKPVASVQEPPVAPPKLAPKPAPKGQ